MKNKSGMMWACGIGAALLGIGLGGVVVAQGNNAAQANAVVARTRIAFMNLQEVIKHYPKYTALQESVKQKDKMYMDSLKQRDDKLKALQTKYTAKETPVTERDKIEAEARIIKTDMENITNEAKKELIKFHDEKMSEIYIEIETVVREYASANGIDVVFRFTEDWNQETYFKPEMVVRRMTMPLWPMYYDQNLNITAVISRNLNARFTSAGGAAPPANNVVPAGAVSK